MSEKKARTPRLPHWYEALIPVVVLLGTMLAATLVWGIDPHVPLVLSCIATALVAAWCGYSWEQSQQVCLILSSLQLKHY